jgi:predicted RNA-binding protein with PIN domain
LIDGYNVMFGDRGLRETYREDRASGLRRFLEVVSRYASLKSIKATVVFDGGRTEEGRISLPSPVNVDTVFVRDADQYIRHRISSTQRLNSLVVVSSDESHVAQFARRQGVGVLSVEEFMAEIIAMDRTKIEEREKPKEETRAGVEYWMKKFRSARTNGE